ncbi:sodium:proton antiporter NhaD [Methylococcus capsulatus]|jgi:Na+/H+ antiporter NhaD/arsenite permease-like protein|uniref:Putative transporter n=1 Tax=Methylococcus capsulatus (strain ATCC 33009 / NCIMB 11132 / Bath) TaxID=243233 RepID=Q606F9_METCA|nr:sodium:proton antiporter NhaD [Methylococcus capsulatus]AAU91669.1 putative transporter [Methylococcus capsulatus str. Bath]QXP87322.1 sodium:proton antiporter NhaD [Methylococcus capsulatus]QXP92937.1 sodium:proton antiporter NhaD [Methylococcus capsulatus]UQN12322.1 sodium:proton antiporter NhaD [Methylococcus capsulatus]
MERPRFYLIHNNIEDLALLRAFVLLLLFLGLPGLALAEETRNLDLTATHRGLYCVLIFIVAYAFVMTEEFTHLRKSKPVILAAGIIWAQVAYMASTAGVAAEEVHRAFEHDLKEYAELMLFLLVAMTYINAMAERNVFEALRSWLVTRKFGYRKLFWITGVITFFLSSVADNLTSALLVGAVVMAVGAKSPKFVSLGFINLVIAANAGGAFSPFGDITTLMVWQAGKAEFFDFFELFIPSVMNFVVPAAFMHFAIPNELPDFPEEEVVVMKPGALLICGLFVLTISIAVSFKQFLHLPPFLGMMVGLSILMFYGYRLKLYFPGSNGDRFDVFANVRDAEWDTLLFFFGVVFAVGGLGYIGYLELASVAMYDGLGATTANIIVGLLSAVVDNIPVMFAVLNMNPDMDIYQWMLVTLTAGVGGSMLSVGSAAGVALMGTSRGMYTFFSHLKWTPAVAAGYIASIATHYFING